MATKLESLVDQYIKLYLEIQPLKRELSDLKEKIGELTTEQEGQRYETPLILSSVSTYKQTYYPRKKIEESVPEKYLKKVREEKEVTRHNLKIRIET